jgi:hypothetical protein
VDLGTAGGVSADAGDGDRERFPQVTVPVGCGQVLRPARLPVLMMITGHAWWLSTPLIPTRHAKYLFAGWRQLIAVLAAMPQVPAIGRRIEAIAALVLQCCWSTRAGPGNVRTLSGIPAGTK